MKFFDLFPSRRLIVIFAVVMTITGCAKSYVDPLYKDAHFNQLSPPQEAVQVALDFTFQTNSKSNDNATKTIRPWLVNVLRGSRVILPVENSETDTSVGKLKVIMNNVADIGEAAGKGFGTGLTFGLVGSMVTDSYVFTAEYFPPGENEAISKSYEHAIHTAIGNKEGPTGLVQMSTMEAFHAVLEDLVIAYLRDMQKDGHLSKVEIPSISFHVLYSSIGTNRVVN